MSVGYVLNPGIQHLGPEQNYGGRNRKTDDQSETRDLSLFCWFGTEQVDIGSCKVVAVACRRICAGCGDCHGPFMRTVQSRRTGPAASVGVHSHATRRWEPGTRSSKAAPRRSTWLSAQLQSCISGAGTSNSKLLAPLSQKPQLDLLICSFNQPSNPHWQAFPEEASCLLGSESAPSRRPRSKTLKKARRHSLLLRVLGHFRLPGSRTEDNGGGTGGGGRGVKTFCCG